jgi:hypothetical protein
MAGGVLNDARLRGTNWRRGVAFELQHAPGADHATIFHMRSRCSALLLAACMSPALIGPNIVLSSTGRGPTFGGCAKTDRTPAIS